MKTKNIEIKLWIYEMYRIAMLPFRLLKEITFDVYLLSDKTKRIMYITSTSSGITPCFIERICSKDVTIAKIKRVYIWDLRKFADQQDAVLIDIYKSFAHSFKYDFLVPERVSQVLDINKPIDEVIKLSSRELNKVNKYKCEISNEHDALKFFYEQMYVPHMKRKYDVFENFIHLEKIFMNGELVFVTLNGKRVSAYLCERINDVYWLSRTAALDEDSVKKGALIAAYYFSILRAKDINAKTVNFGGSNPFLLDGVLRHKNKWGVQICENKNSKRFIYLKNILFDQPFIYVNDNKFKIAIFSEDDNLIKEYADSGLEFNIVETVNKQLAIDKKTGTINIH